MLRFCCCCGTVDKEGCFEADVDERIECETRWTRSGQMTGFENVELSLTYEGSRLRFINFYSTLLSERLWQL